MAALLPPINHPSSIRHRARRRFKDKLAKHLIGIGGIGVIIAITLIFAYLLYVVFPLFMPGKIETGADYTLPHDGGTSTLYLAMEEQAEVGVRFESNGQTTFFYTHDGKIISQLPLNLPQNVTVTSFAASTGASRVVAFGLSDGSAKVLKHEYDVSYPDNVRTITPRISYPLGKAPIQIDSSGRPLAKLAVQSNEEQTTVVALTNDSRLLLTTLTIETSMMDDETTIETNAIVLENAPSKISHLLLDKEQHVVYAATTAGTIARFDISDQSTPILEEQVTAVNSGNRIVRLEFLAGDISILVGDSSGTISQWFEVRDENNDHHLTKIRQFEMPNGLTTLTPEYFRKGFIAIDESGELEVFHTTSGRTVLKHKLSSTASRVAIAPRADAALIEDIEGKTHFLHLHNEHPEVSWSSIWGKVWYESYEKPDYIWQSSSASNDFESKFSLVPVAFGTIKAAFYAMMVAIPLAILGAVYTAYFMTPKMRSTIKPTIEVMEALPTVILGFLAGLWLAPLVEYYLPAIFSLMLLLPLAILTSSYLWHMLPRHIHTRVPDGWTAVLLIPVIIFTVWLAFTLSHPIEIWAFGGDMRIWMADELGINFDQRNAMIVGIAMGFAIIPPIFTITEDAIFGVPKHLTIGSLALGATPWQTLTRVVLLTASPAIFSAVMIGFGRAVGETMIVLMATGNTPVMDFSIFQGLRTLSANIAVEMPESEVNGTHYRILFLAALVLFIFTFFFNTIAEVVRQRLRKKYSSL